MVPVLRYAGRKAVRVFPLVLACLASVHPVQAADSLDWKASKNRVDADITSMDLIPVLEKISEATGWQIFVEPETTRTISTKFQDRTPDKALDLLLGDLNRVLLPRTNGPARLLVFRTTQKEATQLIRPEAKEVADKKSAAARPIPNELIVTLKPGKSIDELAKLLGAKVVGRVDGLNTYRLEFEDEEAAKKAREFLANNEDVASVDHNYPVFRELPIQAYGSAPPLNLVPKAVPDGDRIIVGLIDTMIDPEKSGVKDFLLPAISVAGEAQHIDGQPMHGDPMSQTILRALATVFQEPGGTTVRILPVDVYGNQSMTSTFDVANGIYQAINGGAMLINLSLSSEGESPFLHNVIKIGHQQDVQFIAAAGNEHVVTATYPASWPEVIAVTAGDAGGHVSSYANYGNFVDVVAPGVTVVTYGGQAYRVGGTSVSTAIATGIAAGIKQDTQVSWKQVGEAVLKTLPSISSSPSN
jgi:Subtilase family/Fervidolysin N-terminal prodomain